MSIRLSDVKEGDIVRVKSIITPGADDPRLAIVDRITREGNLIIRAAWHGANPPRWGVEREIHISDVLSVETRV